MAPARRLADLYVIGKEVTFDDGEGDPVSVFVRKLNSVDHDRAVRLANAARARVLSLRSTPTSDDYLGIVSLAYQMDRDGLIQYLVMDYRSDREPVTTAEVGAEEAWDKDNYLTGLQDAWEQGLNDTFAKDPEDTEAKRVFEELKRFQAQVNGLVDDQVTTFLDELESRPDDVLRQQVMEKRLEAHGSIAWITEFRTCEVWLSVREQDRKTRMFNDRTEVNDLPEEVVTEIIRTLESLRVDPMEGKESRATEDSSTSSDSPEKPETDNSSGQESAAA